MVFLDQVYTMEKSKYHNEYYKTLADISRAITFDLYLEDILKLINMLTARIVGNEICSL